MSDLKPIAFRLRPEVHRRLREMSEVSRIPMVEVVSTAIDRMYEAADYEGARTAAEKEASAGVELVRRIEERLGAAFWRRDDVTELAFGRTEEGQVVLVAGDYRYLEDASGRLLRAQVRGGQLVFSTIEEDGSLGDPMAVPVGEPSLN